ncbi:MAG: PhnD/SsuA/transferrin family substrate-binding protein [Thiotrichales bacterium]|nr:PhnD/SsuA/transferrin family substrate-binding protein [Thiotrichales bacterium]
MNNKGLIGILTILLLLAPSVKAESAPAPETPSSLKNALYFSPLPTSNTSINLVKIQPVAQYLSRLLLRPVKPKLYQSYDDIIQALLNNEIQFAELGPLPYLSLQGKNANITPLVTVNKTPNSSRYECVLAAPFDGIQSIEALNTLESPSVALTQPLSTCGWLVTHRLLEEHNFNLEKNDYAFLGSHQKVALALIRKEYSIGGLARFIAERYQPLGLEILQSESMPPFLLVANTQNLSSKELKEVTKALLDYQPIAHKDFNSLGFSVYRPELFDDFLKRYPTATSNKALPKFNSTMPEASIGQQP